MQIEVTKSVYKAIQEHGSDTFPYECCGFYHSHPESPAIPSQYDIDHAWPWFSYLILSVLSGIPREMLAWQLRENRSGFDRVKLQIIDNKDHK